MKHLGFSVEKQQPPHEHPTQQEPHQGRAQTSHSILKAREALAKKTQYNMDLQFV